MSLDVSNTKVTITCEKCKNKLEAELTEHKQGTITAAIKRLDSVGRRQGWKVTPGTDWLCPKHKP